MKYTRWQRIRMYLPVHRNGVLNLRFKIGFWIGDYKYAGR